MGSNITPPPGCSTFGRDKLPFLPGICRDAVALVDPSQPKQIRHMLSSPSVAFRRFMMLRMMTDDDVIVPNVEWIRLHNRISRIALQGGLCLSKQLAFCLWR